MNVEKLIPISEQLEQFMKGNSVVKRKPVTFNGVAPDMKLEQTTKRQKNSQSSITGQSRKKKL